MLVIKMTDNELKFFDDLRNKYPDNILIRTEHGSFQIPHYFPPLS